MPGRFWNWWRGTLVEMAYRQMHTARAQMFDLYDESELVAEVPLVVARANATMHRDDPRRLTVRELLADPPDVRRARMRRLVGDSYEQLDLEHAQLRSFRNILLSAAMFLLAVVAGTPARRRRPPVADAAVLRRHGPGLSHEPRTDRAPAWRRHPRRRRAGALGGALAATLSIRNLKGTSTPYDVPVALAALKVPMGALTAILGLVAIQGDFIPGLTELDSQGQILAYALVFGFGSRHCHGCSTSRPRPSSRGSRGGTDVELAPSVKEDLTAPDERVTPA